MIQSSDRKRPTVSVVVPSYNCGRYLRETIESVFTQTFREYELIVVNDGSTDDTENVLAPFRGQLVYIFQKNKGLPAALNRGLAAASGELFAILDADDVWHPDKLQEQVRFLTEHPEIGLSFTNYKTFGTSAPSQCWFDVRNGTVWHYPHRQVSPHHYVIDSSTTLLQLLLVQAMPKPSSVLFRRECIDRVGVFDESLTFIQDTQMWLRIGKHFGFGFTDLCLLRRRVREDSLATIQNDRRYAYEHIEMLENLGYWIEFTPEEKKAKDRLLAKYCFTAGYLDFSECLLKTSRKHFWKSLKSDVRPKPFIYLCLAFLPKNVIRRLRAMKQYRAFRRPIPAS